MSERKIKLPKPFKGFEEAANDFYCLLANICEKIGITDGDTFGTATDNGDGTNTSNFPDGTSACNLACPPEGTAAGAIPKLQPDGSISWLEDQNTTYDFPPFTRVVDDLVVIVNEVDTDGGASTQVLNQTIEDVFKDVDTLDVSQFSGSVSNGMVTITHSAGGNTSNIQFPLGVSSISTTSNPDGSTTLTYVDGAGNTQTAGVIPAGDISSVTSVTNPDGSVTYTHTAGGVSIPWTISPQVDSGSFSQDVTTGEISHASSSGTTGTANVAVIEDSDPDVSTITDFAGRVLTACKNLFKWNSVVDEDGRTHDASSCTDALELHRTLNVGDPHDNSTGNGDISVAAMDSNHSTTSGAGNGVQRVTTDHDSAIVSSQNTTVDGLFSAAVAARNSETTGVASLTTGLHGTNQPVRTVNIEPTDAGAQTATFTYFNGLNAGSRSILGGLGNSIGGGDYNLNLSSTVAFIEDGTGNNILGSRLAVIEGRSSFSTLMNATDSRVYTDNPVGFQGNRGLILGANSGVIKNAEITTIVGAAISGSTGAITSHPNASIQSLESTIPTYNEGRASGIYSGASNSIKSKNGVILGGEFSIIEGVPDPQTTGTTYPTAANTPPTCNGSLIGGNYRTRVAHSSTVAFTGYGGEGPEPIHESTAHGQFTAAFDNGYRLYTNTQMGVGVEIPRNGTAWVVISDPEKKTKISEVSGALEILDNVGFYNFEYKQAAKKRKFAGVKKVKSFEFSAECKAKLEVLENQKDSAIAELSEKDEDFEKKVKELEKEFRASAKAIREEKGSCKEFTSEIDQFEGSEENQINAGVMADEWAKATGLGYNDGKTVNYNDVVGVLGAAVKELSAQNKALEARLEALEA